MPGTAVKRVDTWRANKLDPTGGQATQSFDPDGTSWLEQGLHRTPTGSLYATPTAELHPETLSVWQIYGTFDVGYLHTTADKTALYDRYTRWPTNGPAFDFDVNAGGLTTAATPRCAAAESAPRINITKPFTAKPARTRQRSLFATCRTSCRPMRDRSSTAREAIILRSPAVCFPARAQYGVSTAKGRA